MRNRLPCLATVRSTLTAALVAATLTACGGGGADGAGGPDIQGARTLNQFGYIPGSGTYVYGYDSIPSLRIEGAPADTDVARIAMAHGAGSYWMFAFRQGSPNQIYAFQFDGGRYAYRNATALTGIPADADVRSLAALHNGTRFRIYLRSRNDPARIYQFDAASPSNPFVLGGAGTVSVLTTTGAPADADFSRWTMFHNGSTYRQAVFQQGSLDTLYQFGWNGSSYAYGYSSTDVVRVVDAPAESYSGNAAILHDGDLYRLYQAAP